MRIATYNVNSVNARLPVLLRWLAETRPDVACLQELKAAQDKFPADALREAGYHAIWHGQKAWNGVAILARAGEPVETGRGLSGDPSVPGGRTALRILHSKRFVPPQVRRVPRRLPARAPLRSKLFPGTHG